MWSFSTLTSLVTLANFVGCRVLALQVGPVADLNITNEDISPDGFTRQAVLAQGVFPGPVITAKKGDHFRLNVIDRLTNVTMLTATSIHWHGLFQHGTNWADGPAFVTQCPITSGNSFLYDFRVPDQAGTFWYHSHLAVQYCDGLRGVMVIKDPNDPFRHMYDVDNEQTVITLSDWYHTAAPNIKGAARPDSTLINGLGRYVNGPSSDLAVINVTYGRRYRFRLVSLSCDPNYIFSIDGHNMTVIEVDGVNHKPYTVDSIQIFAGQRYSFILNANQSKANYWIRALPNTPSLQGFANGINSAILRYNTAPPEVPTSEQSPSRLPLQEVALRPLVNAAAPGRPGVGQADKSINLVLGFAGGKFSINGTSFVPPDVPVLLQILSGARKPEELLPKGSVIGLPPNKVIELSLPGGSVASTGPHPFHLHGHTFSVVRSAGSSTYNYDNPVRRDVVNIGNDPNDNVTIRFKTDNPGPWFLHCHIDFHLDTGFAVVMAEDTRDTAMVNPVPPSWRDLCPTYYNGTSH